MAIFLFFYDSPIQCGKYLFLNSCTVSNDQSGALDSVLRVLAPLDPSHAHIPRTAKANPRTPITFSITLFLIQTRGVLYTAQLHPIRNKLLTDNIVRIIINNHSVSSRDNGLMSISPPSPKQEVSLSLPPQQTQKCYHHQKP